MKDIPKDTPNIYIYMIYIYINYIKLEEQNNLGGGVLVFIHVFLFFFTLKFGDFDKRCFQMGGSTRSLKTLSGFV